MKRFRILLRTEFKAWMGDPLSALGGLIAPTVMLIAFGLWFSGELAFPIAVLNQDDGPYGEVLLESVEQVQSPFGQPYYQVLPLTQEAAWERLAAQRIDAVWVIPPDFSQRLETGRNPELAMHFSNYIDDRAKNHRIYAAEILWHFYHQIGQPGPPLELAEEYPLPEMVSWFPVIGVALVLLGTSLGALFNVFMLTYREHTARVTLELGLSPWPMALILLPKVVLALVMGLATGTALMMILGLWTGIWPGRFLGAVYLFAGLPALFWISVTLLLGLRARHLMAGAIAAILGSILVFFVSGGLSAVQYYPPAVRAIARFFPNAYAVDPLRDLMLFQVWPADGAIALLVLGAFAALGLAAGLGLAAQRLRRLA